MTPIVISESAKYYPPVLQENDISKRRNLEMSFFIRTFAPDLGTRKKSATKKGNAVSNAFLDHAYFQLLVNNLYTIYYSVCLGI